MEIPQHIRDMMDDDPRLKVSIVELNASTIIGNMVEHLNLAVKLDKPDVNINKQLDMVLLHTFNGMTLSKLDECLNYLADLNFEKLSKLAYRKLLSYIPSTHSLYKRIRGNMMYELYRHHNTKEVNEILGLENAV